MWIGVKRYSKRVIKILFDIFIVFSSRFIINDKKLIVFSMSRGRYWDNSRALFEYVADLSSSKYKVVWLSDPALEIESVPERYREKVIPRYSFRGWYFLSKAEVAVISHGFGDYGLFSPIAKSKKALVLWHAITTKYVGLLDEKYTSDRRRNYKLRESSNYTKLISSSDIDRYYSASYTGMDVNNVVITGLPRNDRLFSKTNKALPSSEFFSILYAPTFRDYPVDSGSVFFPFDCNFKEVAEWANSCKIRIYLRPHPNDLDSVRHVQELTSNFPNVFIDARVEKYKDVVDLIFNCDGIVTDYSSIYVDGLILDLPTIFVDYDRDQYIKMRGIAYDYELITPGPKVQNWQDFQYACEEMKDGAAKWANDRELVRKLFFKYRDAKACERVTSLIDEMIKQ